MFNQPILPPGVTPPAAQPKPAENPETHDSANSSCFEKPKVELTKTDVPAIPKKPKKVVKTPSKPIVDPKDLKEEQDRKRVMEAAKGSQFYSKEEKKIREVECKVKRYKNKVALMR